MRMQCYKLSLWLLAFMAVRLFAQLPAFPGAEGYGAIAAGGRGGTVYHVTTLADAGAGSFRDAVSHPDRTVVFDIGGIINLNSDVEVVDNITIAGQTAPGQGIATTGATVYLNHGFGATNSYGHTNIIIRYLRFRAGYVQAGDTYSLALKPARTVMLDHCSIEVGNWQTFSITYNESTGEQPTDITVQNCIVGASVWHQLGTLCWSPVDLTFHHNLLLDNAGRDPKVWGNMQVINDVVYNFRLGIYSDGAEQVDFIGNYQINGPGSNANSVNTGVNVNGTNGGIYYVSGNYWDNNLNGKLDGISLTAGTGSFQPNVTGSRICNPTIPVTVDSAVLAYHKVVCQAGCSLNRDPLDVELASQAASLGTRGPGPNLYMKNTDPTNAWTGDHIPAWTITGGSSPADSDGDGMPDEWELAVGSNYLVADNNIVEANGYTRLENYLNWLAVPHFKTYKNTTAPDFDLWSLTQTFTNLTPVYTVFNPTNGTITLVSNHWAHFAPTTNFTGLGSFTFTVTAASGTKMTNLVGVLVSPIAPATNLVWRGDAVSNSWNLYLTNDWFNGTALQSFNGDDTVTFDNTGSNSLPINLTGQLSPASITVNATKNFTFGGSGSLVGNFTLIKTNTGTLFLPNTNSLFSGLLAVNGGAVVMTNSVLAAGTGLIVLNNALLYTGPIANTISNSGTSTWSITGTGNVQPSSDVVGSGILYVNPTNTSVFTPAGDWSDFAGTVVLTGNNPQFRLYASNLGSARAVFDLGTGNGSLFNRNGGITVQLGSLTGGFGTVLYGATSVAAATTYVIGALNMDSVFNGKISNGGSGITLIRKVGSGKFTLAGANSYSGGTTVSNGALLVNNSPSSGTGTNFVNVYAGATLGGTGVIGGPVSIFSGGTLSPGSPTGTLTVSNSLTLGAGSISSFGFGTNADRVVVKGNLTLGGTLNVTNLGDFAVGTNTLFTYVGTLSGSLTMGTMPAGFKCLLATNVAGQVNLIVTKPVITATAIISNRLVFSGTGGLATSNYYVLTTTNLSLPIASWSRQATNQFDSAGGFRFTNNFSTSWVPMFYVIQIP